MNPSVDLDRLMNQFRLASRELFNHFFYVPDPYNNGQHSWLQEEQFRKVQSVLFRELVAGSIPFSISEYGYPQENILVESRCGGSIPVMLNRETDSAYWDYPVKEIGINTRMLFVSFFDWDQLDYRDNRYVRVQIDRCSMYPDIVGKHGLIESRHIQFTVDAFNKA